MKKLIPLLFLLAVSCAFPQITITSVDLNKHNKLFSLKTVNKKALAFLPIRNTTGTPASNNLVKNNFYKEMRGNLPNLKLVRSKDIYKLLDKSKIQNIYPKYSNLLERYFKAGKLTNNNDWNIFESVNIDYLVITTINSGLQDSPSAYLFLISVQIWEVGTKQMVWDTTVNGSVIIKIEEDITENKIALIKYLCNAILERLS